MTGNTNPQVLTNLQAQAVANLLTSNANHQQLQQNGNIPHIYQARLCADCWSYWKKFAQFKFANAKQERLNQLKNQVHRCSVNGCGREFKMKQLLIKHCGVAHGYFPKVNNPNQAQNDAQQRSVVRNRTAFFLLTTPMTRAARFVCTQTIKLRKLAKRPFKLVELSELNKEWYKDKDRVIQKTLDEHKLVRNEAKRKLDVARIDVIRQARQKSLKKQQQPQQNGVNGHDDEASNDLVIDQNMEEEVDDDVQQEKPEYMRYFEQKATEPCYTPAQLLFPKPTSGKIC
jgi:hypothetical protein